MKSTTDEWSCVLISLSSWIFSHQFSLFWPDSSSLPSQKSEPTAERYWRSCQKKKKSVFLCSPFFFVVVVACLSHAGASSIVQAIWINGSFQPNDKLVFLLAENYIFYLRGNFRWLTLQPMGRGQEQQNRHL